MVGAGCGGLALRYIGLGLGVQNLQIVRGNSKKKYRE